jgi:hypothetical protein
MRVFEEGRVSLPEERPLVVGPWGRVRPVLANLKGGGSYQK